MSNEAFCLNVFERSASDDPVYLGARRYVGTVCLDGVLKRTAEMTAQDLGLNEDGTSYSLIPHSSHPKY